MISTLMTSLAILVALLDRTIAAPAPEPALQLVRHGGLAKVYSGCIADNTVALTFDDGPYIYETEISNLLKSNGIKGTFFVNGDNYDCIYDERQVRTIKNTFAAGHQFASHAWTHEDLTTLTWDEIQDELRRVELALSRIIGVKPAFMRPPFGSYNDLVRRVSFTRNQSLVLWDFYSGDVTDTVAQSKQLYTDIIEQHPPNILALNHETYQTTAEQVIPFAITGLKAAGYKFATVAECLGLQPYFSITAPETRTSDWHC